MSPQCPEHADPAIHRGTAAQTDHTPPDTAGSNFKEQFTHAESRCPHRVPVFRPDPFYPAGGSHFQYGKAVIQPAALTLSNLDNEDTLEMHTLDNAIVLLKEDMTSVEKYLAFKALGRLVDSLSIELVNAMEEEGDLDGDESDEDFCDDTIPIPVEAFEDAGIWGKNLHIQVIDGAVVITADVETDDSFDKTMQTASKYLFESAVALNMACQLLTSGGADA